MKEAFIKRQSTQFSSISLLKELARKSIHVATCLTALFLIQHDFLVLELLFLPIISIGFYISEKVDILGRTLSFGTRRKWGGIFLAIGLSLIFFLPLDYEARKFAVLILMIADVLASIIGKIIPIKKVEVLGAYKSIGGSLAFALGVIIALSLSFQLPEIAIYKTIFIILSLEIFEFFNWLGVDNITLPLIAASSATLFLI